MGNKHTWDNLFFQNYEKGLESEVEKLRENGAHALLVLCSEGLNCTNKNETSPLNIIKQQIHQNLNLNLLYINY